MVNVNLLVKNPALIPSYDLNLSSSTRGGGRVSFSIGGSVTGSTPQKSSVKRARMTEIYYCVFFEFAKNIFTHMAPKI